MNTGFNELGEGYSRHVRHGARCLCTFSGGKDSGLALGKALESGEVLALVHILIDDKTLYHGQPREVIETQAEALGIPLATIGFKWWRDQSRAVAFLEGWRELGADCVVFGDLSSRYMVSGHAPVCEAAGMEACNPICDSDYNFLVDELERLNVKSIVTKINDSRIDTRWLGETFSREMYREFEAIGIDPFGENDEFHTTLVDAIFFEKPLKYSLSAIDEYNLLVRPR